MAGGSFGHCIGGHADFIDDGVAVGSDLDGNSRAQSYAVQVFVITAGRPVWGEVDEGYTQIFPVSGNSVEVFAARRESQHTKAMSSAMQRMLV